MRQFSDVRRSRALFLLSLLFFFEDDFLVRLKKSNTYKIKGEPEPQTPTFVLMSSIIKHRLKNKNKHS